MDWSWLSFVVGLLVGWLVEWVIDYLFWRRKRRDQATLIEDLQGQKEEALDRQRELEGQAAQCAQDLAACRAALDECREAAQEVETRAAAAIPLDLEAESAADGEEQDLTRIEGIGPKSAELLREAGIVNYAQLADTPVERLQEILDAAGSRFRMIRPDTWAQQARLAAEDKWDDLKVLQRCIVGGVIVKHDLTRIEGVGPKIEGLLNEAEMVNYNQVAAAPVPRLQEILDAAGPRYRMADPSTWPEQARLAAEDKWDELQALQDRLSGGREIDEPADE